ncbi:hypothetical protein JW756_02610 [Candidatus Woesearchaeota archaeon]|nr:hypothetical protein [Candidatus Woesearchaeota archaeon]
MAKTKRKGSKSYPHSPNLKTILMVEDVLKDNADRILKPAELKRMLPKKVNHNTLMNIVDYLDRSNKIAFNSRGMLWIVNDSPKLRKAIAEGTNH